MFTGLVEGMGRVSELRSESDAALRVAIEVPEFMAGEASLGESVAINGCCLTVVEFSDSLWQFQAGEETLSKTTLGNLKPGERVNLERSLRADARLGGHFVQGHVDGTGTVSNIDRDGEWIRMAFEVPRKLSQLMVPKGSIAVDGVSLTIVDALPESFSIALIPHTLEVTTLGHRRVGDLVNLEADILGKYVLKLLQNIKSGGGLVDL
ncbi:MAG TPA: riboflavin synthase [Planctomycetaceae bacterium]|nr:riboflavin synthase [Planctomycetaceae bacterium]